MNFKELVAKNLDELIKNSGKQKQVIADELDVDQSVISKFTNGKALPSPENIKKLCKILDCDYSDIMGKL